MNATADRGRPPPPAPTVAAGRSSGADAAESVDASLRRALADHLEDGRRLSDMGQGLLAVVTTFVFWDSTTPAVGLGWLAAVLLSAALRWTHRQRVLSRLENPDARLRRLRVDVWTSAALWGLGGPLLIGEGEAQLALLLLIYAGLMAAATSTTVADKAAFHGFTALLLVPMAATVGWGGVSRDELSLLLMTFLFAPFMVLVHRRAQNVLREQIIAHELLRISEEGAAVRTKFLNSLLAAAPNPIVVLDSAHRILSVNPAFERVTGRSGTTGSELASLLASPDDQSQLDAFLEAVEGGERVTTEINVPHEDGSQIWMRLSGRSSAGAGVGSAILIGEDVTALVAAREAQAEARRAAEESSRAKGLFLASMSHEIRTPMNGVMGMIDLLIDSPLDTQQREWAEILRSSADSLLGILNDILDMSKIDAGQLRLEQLPFDLSKLSVDTISAFAPRAAARGIELVLDVAPDVGQVVGDPVRIRQLISNLLSNAIKFTEKGEVALSVRRVEPPEGPAVVRISVRDTGMGIPRDKQEMIFEEFSQADLSTTRTHGGTGLGLSIVRRLASMMNGKVTLQSEVGRGSEFVLELPLPILDSPVGERPAEIIDIEGVRLLVVDDNETARRIVRSIVEDADGIIDEADSAQPALDMIGAKLGTPEAYRVVLVDALLPIVDGFAIAEAVARMPAAQRPRVLMLTAAATSDMAERARGLGVGGLLDKPVSRWRLLKAIALLLKPSRTDGPERRLVTNRTLDHVPKAGLVLVADDNKVNQHLVVALLQKRGFAVDTVENGRMAVDHVMAGKYDLVLMDVEMPVMDGLEATREIRRLRGDRVPPIVALTAHAVDGHEAACMEAGMDAFLTKPLKAPLLYELIDRIRGTSPKGQSPSSVSTETKG